MNLNQTKLYRTIPMRPEPAWSKRWRNFVPVELACGCNGKFCDGEYYHDPFSLDALQAARDIVGRRFIINSGHRCVRYNPTVGGAKNSAHLKIAFDIDLTGHDRHALRKVLESCGFTGIGLGRNFIHADIRKKPTVWDYGEASRVAWGLDA